MLAGFSARDCQYHFYVAYKASNRPKYFDYRPIERREAIHARSAAAHSNISVIHQSDRH